MWLRCRKNEPGFTSHIMKPLDKISHPQAVSNIQTSGNMVQNETVAKVQTAKGLSQFSKAKQKSKGNLSAGLNQQLDYRRLDKSM